MSYTYKNSKGDTYYLHERSGTGRGGEGHLFFFSKKEGDDTLEHLPEGYEVKENERTGLPVVKKQ